MLAIPIFALGQLAHGREETLEVLFLVLLPADGQYVNRERLHSACVSFLVARTAAAHGHQHGEHQRQIAQHGSHQHAHLQG